MLQRFRVKTAIIMNQEIAPQANINSDALEVKEKPLTRDELVKIWKEAEETVIDYPAGTAVDSQGKTYEYANGVRLWIGNEKEVMDSCQRPWAIETVDKAFEALGPTKKNVNLLERGFGIGLIAGEAMDHLRRRGGTYTVIELNDKNYSYAKEKWLPKQESIEQAKATSEIGGTFTEPKVVTKIIQGDAIKETEKMASEGKKFDIIISDTFPLSEDEKSINDLMDLSTLIKCLNPDGVFAFFGYHSEFQGGMNEKQRNLLDRTFENVSRTMAKGINPPPDYKYFHPKNGSVVRELPVIICTKPRIQPEA